MSEVFVVGLGVCCVRVEGVGSLCVVVFVLSLVIVLLLVVQDCVCSVLQGDSLSGQLVFLPVFFQRRLCNSLPLHALCGGSSGK